MGYTDVDQLAINTIRVLAVCSCPSPLSILHDPAPAKEKTGVLLLLHPGPSIMAVYMINCSQCRPPG
jgi:hypothetical protein